jgi:outer membrane biosynthesis protein TonB
LTRNKLWRLSLAAILGFGWLFLTPAYSDDPLSLAAQEIQELNEKVGNLTEKAETQALIDIAEDKYDAAVAAKAARDAAYNSYNLAVEAEVTALSEKNSAQSAVDNQIPIVAAALQDKNDAQDVLDIANINLSNTPVPSVGYQGVAFEIYPLSRSGNYAYIAPGSGLICQGGIPTFDAYAGWGAICGANQNFIGIFRATLTVPANINSVYFAAATDDGSRIYVDGVLESELWEEQGTTWSPYTRTFNTTTDKTLDLEVWWYNGGGPGNMHVGWGHSGIWTGIPNQYLSFGQGSSQEVFDAYNAAVTAQQSAQTIYNNKASYYNTQNQNLTILNQNLTSATQNLTTKQENLTTALDNKNNTESAYDQSIINLNNAIEDAWDLYNETWLFEEQQRVAAAIATALANMPQPTPEPTVEPSTEPTGDPSEEPSPTPESSPSEDEASNEPEPSPEPTPDPSQTETTEPEPSPESTPIVKPTPETTVGSDSENNVTNIITQETANLIADLTSKDTLAKLTPEQKAAVAEGLGIRASEIAKVAALAATDKNLATALQEFGDRIKENVNAPMPYTLADATTEVATEAFLADPIGAFADIDFEKLLSPSEWGKDMTDDQREKAQEVVIPVIIAGNIVAAAMTRRI